MMIDNPPIIAPDDEGILGRSYPRGKKIASHMHIEAQLLFAASGIMQVTTPKGRWLVPPERAVWLPPRLVHTVDVLAPVEMRTLLVTEEKLAAHPEAKNLHREFVVAVRPLLRELILGSFAAGQPLRRRELLAELALFELAEAEDGATFIPLPLDQRARRVAELVLADPGGVLEIDDLVRAAGASARTISRLFTAETQLTFKEWRQRARIMAAVEMLGNGRPSMKQVAARVGFANAASFAFAFRQIMGVSPGQMLPRAKDAGAADSGH